MKKLSKKTRSILFILVGVLVLLLKRQYVGPEQPLLDAYLGNVSASFAVFFIVGILITERKWNPWLTPVAALLVVELFELTNGFGIMANIYDPLDFVANIFGVGLAFLVDRLFVGNEIKEPRTEEK